MVLVLPLIPFYEDHLLKVALTGKKLDSLFELSILATLIDLFS